MCIKSGTDWRINTEMRHKVDIKRYLSIPSGQYPWINMNIIMVRKSAKLIPSEFRRKENGAIDCQTPHAPPLTHCFYTIIMD